MWFMFKCLLFFFFFFFFFPLHVDKFCLSDKLLPPLLSPYKYKRLLGQHNFVAYRNDRRGAAPAICFAGEQWRDYVPIRLPWTVCIRERVPPGIAAVLLNPAHKHSDLVLPIDEFESDLFRQIDGARTLGEIARVDLTTKNVPTTLSFFQRLWRYDQIVFDASRVRDTISTPVH